MSTFDETAGHDAATVLTRQSGVARRPKLRQVERAMAHLLTHADRQRRRTGLEPAWLPFLLSVSQARPTSPLSFPRCFVNARTSHREDRESAGELLQLAYCAWNAELELTLAPRRRPGVRQMGLAKEPHFVHPAETAAVLIGEAPPRIVIAAAASRPEPADGLENFARAFLYTNAERIVPAACGAPGTVNRQDLALARRLWSAVEKYVPTTARNLVLTGHGQAAAAVTLAALVARSERPGCQISVVTFGSPPVGDRVFQNYYDLSIPRHVRIESEDDIVPHLGVDPLLLSLAWPKQAARLRELHTVLKHVGRLQYFHDGHLAEMPESDLSRSRRFRMFSLLCSGDRETAIRDHSLADGYLPVLAAAGRPT